MLKFRHNRKPPSSLLLLWQTPEFKMSTATNLLSLCATRRVTGGKLTITFTIAYMRGRDNKNIEVNWIALVRSRGLVEMTVMISPVKEIAPLPLLIYGLRQEFITVLRSSGVPRGGWGFQPPPPRNSEDIGGVLNRISKKNRHLDFLL